MQTDLEEFVDISSLQQLMESLWKASGIPVGVFDLDGQVLAAAGVQDLCAMFHREHPAIARHCPERETVTRAFVTRNRTLEEIEIVEHGCRHGLTDIAVPIIIESRHLANLNLGKFFYEKPDKTSLQIEARSLGLDEKEYVRAMDKVAIFSRNRIEEILEFHVRLIQLLVEIGVKTLQQRQADQAMRQALGEVEESRDRIDAILRSVADGLIVTDMAHRLLLINRPAELLLGLESAQVLKRPLEEVLTSESLKEHLTACHRGHEETATIDFELEAALSATQRDIQARISVMRNREGMKTGLIMLLRDTTRERELDRMKSEFVSTAAHELRTPLTSIMGFSELLQQKDIIGPELQEECLGYIHRNAEVLQEIIDDLFILSRFQAGETVQMEQVPCNLEERLGNLIEQYRARSAIHQFMFNLPHPMPPMVIDCDKVLQVLENLLSNAVKFSPDGGLIRVEGALEGRVLQLTVRDQGIGMTKAQLARIFDKFYRADASNTAAPGLGLGMALAKSIIEAHGGTIQAASRPGEGTAISFTLPLTPADKI
jgi:PAS domain S-box-containing protein